jgi:hypothetical protein
MQFKQSRTTASINRRFLSLKFTSASKDLRHAFNGLAVSLSDLVWDTPETIVWVSCTNPILTQWNSPLKVVHPLG